MRDIDIARAEFEMARDVFAGASVAAELAQIALDDARRDLRLAQMLLTAPEASEQAGPPAVAS